jgi:DNA-binding response OmpR family regulator
MKKRILVVEDDASLGRVMLDQLIFEGFDARLAVTGATATGLASQFRPDLIVLDVMLPDCSGFDLYPTLSRPRQCPVIFVTARGQKVDKLKGLGLGADDYITKPFDLEELLARVKNVLRRTRTDVDVLLLGDVTVDLQQQQVVSNRRTVHLTHREVVLLRYLAERRDRIVHRDELLRDVWGYAETPLTRSVDSAIARLRKKIEAEPHRPRYIHTVHGDGYCLTSSARTSGPGSS